ncbi:hypothetical protein Bbelb_157270 [Branchiostoma belcheri]|nr:hypothetical protein Bbelb_157270 [Branchiostoma belcheri]
MSQKQAQNTGLYQASEEVGKSYKDREHAEGVSPLKITLGGWAAVQLHKSSGTGGPITCAHHLDKYLLSPQEIEVLRRARLYYISTSRFSGCPDGSKRGLVRGTHGGIDVDRTFHRELVLTACGLSVPDPSPGVGQNIPW